jgi:hypothetical protein
MTDTTTTTVADTTTATAPVWHQNVPPDVKGWWESKGYDFKEPGAFAQQLTDHYRKAEGKLGVPQDQLLRMPQANAQPAEIDAFWQRLGAPKEAKDLDFSGIKTAAGEALDVKMTEAIAAAAISSRAPKEAVASITGAVQKYLDGIEAERKTLATTRTNEQVAALKKNWGPNYDTKVAEAKRTFNKWATAAGMDAVKATEAIDAISHLGGVGAASFMELLDVLGTRMSEDRWVDMKQPANPDQMSREAAKARMEELKKDTAWGQRWKAGGVAEQTEWKKLIQVATGQSEYAA